jgi:hypothetical protein
VAEQPWRLAAAASGARAAVVWNDIILTQSAYIDKMESEHSPNDKPVKNKLNKTPCDKSLDKHVADALSADIPDPPDSAWLTQQTRYWSLVGALLYCATNTRPDIALRSRHVVCVDA